MFRHKETLKFAAVATAASLAPLVGLAQVGDPNFNYLNSAIQQISALVNNLVPLTIALALLFFIWGLVQFILASGDEEAKTAGKRKIVWGIVALFVIISVWGLVGLLNQLTGVEQGTGFTLPDTGL